MSHTLFPRGVELNRMEALVQSCSINCVSMILSYIYVQYSVCVSGVCQSVCNVCGGDGVSVFGLLVLFEKLGVAVLMTDQPSI